MKKIIFLMLLSSASVAQVTNYDQMVINMNYHIQNDEFVLRKEEFFLIQDSLEDISNLIILATYRLSSVEDSAGYIELQKTRQMFREKFLDLISRNVFGIEYKSITNINLDTVSDPENLKSRITFALLFNEYLPVEGEGIRILNVNNDKTLTLFY